jgi:uncharacterized membrane protein
MINKKTLIYLIIAFVLGFGVTFVVIKSFKKDKNQEVIEKVEAK